MASELVLETKRLRLKTWNAEHGRLLNEYCNNDEVLAHLGGTMTAKKHQELVDWLIWQQKTYGITFWALERKRGGDFLGFCASSWWMRTTAPFSARWKSAGASEVMLKESATPRKQPSRAFITPLSG
jgi:RimJ/RimL family protein N-acetyltransferase